MNMIKTHILSVFFITAFLATGLIGIQSVWAEEKLPPRLEDMMEIQPIDDNPQDLSNQAPNIRRDAIKNAALSYGARGGLTRRSYEIQEELKSKAYFLDRTYNFNQLLIKGPSGLMIEPPIVSESVDNLLIEGEGQSAAVAEMMLRINKKAKIVPTGRNWRSYLERDWGDVTRPPDLLLPQNSDERKIWRENVRKGWEKGYEQGDDIFESDLNRLVADFEGMVRYRMLLKQNMISAPFALLEDRGVTGGGNEMRVGDRAVQITGPSQLQARPQEWQPASR